MISTIFNKKEGLIPRSLLRNKLSEAGANTPLLAAGKFITAPVFGMCDLPKIKGRD